MSTEAPERIWLRERDGKNISGFLPTWFGDNIAPSFAKKEGALHEYIRLDLHEQKIEKLVAALEEALCDVIDWTYEEDKDGKNKCYECEVGTSKPHEPDCYSGKLIKQIEEAIEFSKT